MSSRLKVISPVDGSVYLERDYANGAQIEASVASSRTAQKNWKQTPLAERRQICQAFVKAVEENAQGIAEEITWQMGRPLVYSPGEVCGLAERARYMIDVSPEALADIDPGERQGFRRFIRREPLGIVFAIAAWNYPYLIAVNSVIPALLAGNSVILKHSAQTPRCAERFAECFEQAGLPKGVFQYLHLDHAATDALVKDPRINFVAFTGSVRGGHAIQQAASDRFVGTGMELGGKDPAYVRPDAVLTHAVENLVDGSFFNSGQSCCGIERIYVHDAIYDDFIEAFVDLTRQYQLGNPLHATTNLGPMVRTSAARFVREQIEAAIAAGARALIDPRDFPADDPVGPYLAPQVLVDVNHQMAVMREETFGPCVGIQRVRDDEAAINLMNDSRYGLTASIWTTDDESALRIGNQIETGTVFMNRCDYLDPALAWVGVKDSGRGCTLSTIGFEHLTRPKSYHLRHVSV